MRRRAWQFALAFVAQSSAQRSALWWAAKHRHHHLHSDTKADVHSPRHTGFLYSHLGWIFARKHSSADLTRIADFTRYPELRWLHKHELVPPACLAILCLLLAGWPGLVVGFFWSTVVLYHATFSINSLAHVRGRKRYVTGDDSRNNWLLALLTSGEGWHNNHHAYQSSVRQGFRWWEIDTTFYALKALSWLGVVWNLKSAPAEVLRNDQRLGSRMINRAAEELASRFNAERIALSVIAALHGPTLSSLQESLTLARVEAKHILTELHLPQLPTRAQFLAEAKAHFAKTPSLDDIVERAYEILLNAVGARVMAPI
jgi:stearoyl-CoA desaturase (delta-9 desaturase)